MPESPNSNQYLQEDGFPVDGLRNTKLSAEKKSISQSSFGSPSKQANWYLHSVVRSKISVDTGPMTTSLLHTVAFVEFYPCEAGAKARVSKIKIVRARFIGNFIDH